MILDKLKVGNIIVEISAKSPERILNLLWNSGIKSKNIVKIDITTIRLEIEYNDYNEVVGAVKRCGGKIKIISKNGWVFLISRLKRQISLVLGLLIFIIGIFYLSTYIWSIDIQTGNNLSPYQVRKELKKIGIEPGIKKSKIDVYNIEDKAADINSDILWIRARVEGSTLKIVIEEKVNPPKPISDTSGDCVAKVGGEIKRVFVSSGTSNVSPGDFVNAGDVLIKGMQGKEGEEYEVPAKGIVIANTFYEKEMEVQVSGSKLEKTGKRGRDIYVSFFGRKIYLKKAINNFKYYDKIEDEKGFIKTTTYFERAEKEVNLDKEEAIKTATEQLTESFVRTLSNDYKIANKDVYTEDIGEGKLRVKVTFVVEQDIASVS